MLKIKWNQTKEYKLRMLFHVRIMIIMFNISKHFVMTSSAWNFTRAFHLNFLSSCLSSIQHSLPQLCHFLVLTSYCFTIFQVLLPSPPMSRLGHFHSEIAWNIMEVTDHPSSQGSLYYKSISENIQTLAQNANHCLNEHSHNSTELNSLICL